MSFAKFAARTHPLPTTNLRELTRTKAPKTLQPGDRIAYYTPHLGERTGSFIRYDSTLGEPSVWAHWMQSNEEGWMPLARVYTLN